MAATAPPAEILRTLGHNARRIEVAAATLPPEDQVDPPRGGWSAREILWHIRAVGDVHREHAMRILNEDEPRWRHVSPRARMKQSRYDQQPFVDSLAAFIRAREELLERLNAVPDAGWGRAAIVRVPHRNDDWRLTLQELLWGMANHEQSHCTQLEALAAAQKS